MGSGERGWPFVVGMIAVLCALCALAALLGVPAAGGLFLASGGMLLGIGAARVLLPRRDWGLTGKTILMFVAIGGIFVGTRFSVLDYSTLWGVFFWGLYLGFWPAAASRLTEPLPPPTRRKLRTGAPGPRRPLFAVLLERPSEKSLGSGWGLGFGGATR